MRILFLVAGILCVLYFGLLILYNGIHTSFAAFWLIAGIGLILIYLVGRREFRMHDLQKRVLVPAYTIVITAVFLFVLVSFQVLAGMATHYSKDASYLVILGCQVRNGRPSPVLKDRLDTGLEYLEAHPDTFVIVSGGLDKYEKVTEAEVMAQYLMEHGIGRERIIHENRSTNTTQNLMYSADFFNQQEETVVIVTSNFHITRTRMLAGKLGYGEVESIAAPSDRVLLLNYMIREVFAILFEKLTAVL